MLCTTREHRKPRFDHNTTVGAGVVLFTVIGRTLFFVLARERYVRFWKGSLKWSGFEGASMRDETDVQTATRELREETLDSFSDTGVTDELKKGRFAMKVVASCKHTGRKHVTYLEEVGDCGPCIERFRHTRQRIQRITSLLSKLKIIQCKLETYNAHLSATGSEFPLPFPAARYVEGQDIFLVKDVLSVRFTATQMLVVFTYQPTNTGTATLEKQTCHDVRTMCDDASRYGEWFTLRGELTRLCAEVDVHCPGALECTWSGGVHPTDVKVQDAYMEKDNVQLWSLEEIEHLARGERQGAIFKGSFLPVLRAIVRVFGAQGTGQAPYTHNESEFLDGFSRSCEELRATPRNSAQLLTHVQADSFS